MTVAAAAPAAAPSSARRERGIDVSVAIAGLPLLQALGRRSRPAPQSPRRNRRVDSRPGGVEVCHGVASWLPACAACLARRGPSPMRLPTVWEELAGRSDVRRQLARRDEVA